MFAIIQLGSEQFKVSPGDVIKADRVEAKEGKELALDKVLMFADGDNVQVGQPFLKGAKVLAKVVEHDLGDKVIAFKCKRRKNYAKKIGHRRQLTAYEITAISAK